MSWLLRSRKMSSEAERDPLLAELLLFFSAFGLFRVVFLLFCLLLLACFCHVVVRLLLFLRLDMGRQTYEPLSWYLVFSKFLGVFKLCFVALLSISIMYGLAAGPYKCVCVCMYVCMHACMYVCMCVSSTNHEKTYMLYRCLFTQCFAVLCHRCHLGEWGQCTVAAIGEGGQCVNQKTKKTCESWNSQKYCTWLSKDTLII